MRILEWEGMITFMDAYIRRPIDLGAAIRRLRTNRGMTQDDLAQAAGVSRRWIGMVEAGKNPGVQFDMIIHVLSVLSAEVRIVAEEASHA